MFMKRFILSSSAKKEEIIIADLEIMVGPEGFSSSLNHFVKPINILSTNKAILMSFGFNENIAGGYQKAPATEDSFGALNKVIPYVNEKGEFTDFMITIRNQRERDTFNANLLPVNSITNFTCWRFLF